ncbi:MAG: hypothetical protein GY716_10530 [bacterium]|nr:hypothetical protein [bacterium]
MPNAARMICLLCVIGLVGCSAALDRKPRVLRDLSPREFERGVPAVGAARGLKLAGSVPGSDVLLSQADPNFQEETSIAADPTNANTIVGVWQDFVTIKYGYSSDGGASFQNGVMEFASRPDERYFDPAIAAAGNGVFYVAMIGFGGTQSGGLIVAKSTDGGKTFSSPLRINSGGDKPYLTVDPVNGNVYVVWAESTAQGFTVFFSRSIDDGASFSAKVAISNMESEGNGAYPIVGPGGEIHVIWALSPTNELWYDRSLDQGLTWMVDDVRIDEYTLPRSPLQGNFRNPPIPAIGVDRSGGAFDGRVYAVWGDNRFGDPDILVSHSDDGTTWSAPVRANDDAIGNDADQWFPWVVVDGNGHVQVTFLDRREDSAGLLYGMYLASSTDGGQTFGPNVRLSDGIYGPTDNEFLGDYSGAAVSPDLRIHPLWPDGRNGDLDVFSHSVDLVDYDEDLVLNDGDSSGQYADNRCTGGQVASCDDNCPGAPNPGQADQDGDRVGDACDNCPGTVNTGQPDIDRDGLGDACDPCPQQVGGDTGDLDGDAVLNCNDNCPIDVNPGQADLDQDGLGDTCDSYPADPDNDGVTPGNDNCETAFNPAQRDTDGDGRGDFCDTCPELPDPGQEDGDGDGRGDACDCEPADSGDRLPRDVADLLLQRTPGAAATLSWSASPEADVYSISRGALASLVPGEYGDCLAEAVLDPTHEDDEDPAPGQGWFYLVQTQNFDCGLGGLGFDSDELERVNSDPSACQGGTKKDAPAIGEIAVEGTVTGSFLDTLVSDGQTENIREVLTSQAGVDFGVFEHRWKFSVTPGRRIEFHAVAFRYGAEMLLWDYSIDGGANWIPFDQPPVPRGTSSSDLTGLLPDDLAGAVEIRARDRFRFPLTYLILDTTLFDQLFIRTVN